MTINRLATQSIWICIILSAVASPAAAEFFADYDWVRTTISNKGSSSVSGTLDITSDDGDGGVLGLRDRAGFEPGVDHAVSGSFSALLHDDQLFDRSEWATVSLEGMQIGSSFAVNFDFFNNELSALLLGAVNATGMLDWEISVSDGRGTRDFVVSAVGLDVTTGVPTSATPEPSTFATWGLIALTWAGGAWWMRGRTR